MKTTSPIVKTALLIAVLATGIVLCSFTGSKNISKIKTTGLTNDEEYYKVRSFIQENICNVIRKKQGSGTSSKSFSRCPSGYQSNIAGDIDSVKTEKFTYGTINLFKGCSPTYVCDFKVCVAKGIAEVRSKDMKEYVTVAAWLEMRAAKKAEPAEQVKEKRTEVKG